MQEARVTVDLYEAFKPLVDFSMGSRMGFLDKKVAQAVMGRDSERTDLSWTWAGGTTSGTGRG
jgi:hypothetical protein